MATPLYDRLIDLALIIGAYRGYWPVLGVQEGDEKLYEELSKSYSPNEMAEACKIARARYHRSICE